MGTDDLQGARIISETYPHSIPSSTMEWKPDLSLYFDGSCSSASYWKAVWPCNADTLHWNILSSAAPI